MINNKNYKISVVNIEINFEEVSSVTSSTILPLLSSEAYEKNPNDQAIADYNDFIIMLQIRIEDLGYILEDNAPKQSPYSYSYYFDLFSKTKDNEEILHKFVLYVRISDHLVRGLNSKDENERRRAEESQKKYFRNKTAEYEKKYNTSMKFDLKNIIIDNNKFSSYEEALDYIEENLKVKRNVILKRFDN